METTSLPRLPVRLADTHKGDYGKVLVIAGSETMIGAPALAALAALRSGSGLVRICAPKEIIPAVLTLCPYATAMAWSATKIKDVLAYAEEHDALAVGPGLGTSSAVKRLILELLERHHGPMVLDADALNVLAALEPSEWPKRRNWGNIVLTPHMGEYMRLIAGVMKRGANVTLSPATGATNGGAGEDAGEDGAAAAAPGTTKKTKSLVDEADDAPSTADGIALDLPEAAGGSADSGAPAAASPSNAAGDKIENQKSKIENSPDRTPLAELLARGTGANVVLKGHRTVVTDGHTSHINQTGNPAMATAGAGDVLTGMIAALLGQKLSAFDAAVLAVHVHGAAGDLARAAFGPEAIGLLSMDLINKIPEALCRHIGAPAA